MILLGKGTSAPVATLTKVQESLPCSMASLGSQPHATLGAFLWPMRAFLIIDNFAKAFSLDILFQNLFQTIMK